MGCCKSWKGNRLSFVGWSGTKTTEGCVKFKTYFKCLGVDLAWLRSCWTRQYSRGGTCPSGLLPWISANRLLLPCNILVYLIVFQLLELTIEFSSFKGSKSAANEGARHSFCCRLIFIQTPWFWFFTLSILLYTGNSGFVCRGFETWETFTWAFTRYILFYFHSKLLLWSHYLIHA